MKALGLIQKYFINGVAPKNADISDHFAMGCWLIIKGMEDAGIKMIRGAIKLMGSISHEDEQEIVDYARGNAKDAFTAVKPHYEIEKLAQK